MAHADFTRGRLTRRRLDAFVAAHASARPALVVHSHDVDHARHFPSSRWISPRASRPQDACAEPPYAQILAEEPEGAWPLVLCTGLLEHVPDPQATVKALARALSPGGRLLLSASGVFSYHGGSRNYFHFAPNGLRRLLEGAGLRVEELCGSTGPFETLGVLAQRIAIQCETSRPTRALLGALAHVLPLLDPLARTGRPRAGGAALEDAGLMPATLLATATKAR